MAPYEDDLVPQDPPPQGPQAVDWNAVLDRRQPSPSLQDGIDWNAVLDKRFETNEQLLQTAYAYALQSDPNMRAEAQHIARNLGVDPDTAERNIQVMRAQLRQRALQQAEFSLTSPQLAKYLQNIEFARIAHDDVENLSQGEKMQRSFERGQLVVRLGRLAPLGWKEIDPKNQAEAEQILRQLQRPVSEDSLSSLAEVFGQWSETVPAALKSGAAAGSAAIVAGRFLPAAAKVFTGSAAFGIGFTAEMASQSLLVEGGNAYFEMIQMGYKREVARWAALGVGVFGAALEMTGAAVATKPIRAMLAREVAGKVTTELARPTTGKALRDFLVNYVEGRSGEVATEVAQEFVQIAGEEAARVFSRAGDSPYNTPEGRKELVDRIASVAVKTAKTTALLGLPLPAARFVYDQRRVAEAEARIAEDEKFLGLASASKLRTRAPEAYREYAEDLLRGKDNETTYIDGGEFQKVLRQSGPEESASLERAIPGITEQVDSAARNGEDVAVPTASYMAHIVGTEIDTGLRPHRKYDPNDFSQAEVELVKQTAPDLLKELVSEADKDVELDEKLEEKLKDVESKFVEAVRGVSVALNISSAQAKAVGELVREAYRQLSRRANVSVDRLPTLDIIGTGATEDTASVLDQPTRGSYFPDRLAIALTQRSDVSTLLHELTHGLFDIYTKLASNAGAEPVLVGYVNDMLSAVGIKDLSSWNSMTFEQQRKANETLAMQFEEYIKSGKAPTVALEGVFHKLAAWVRRAYALLKSSVNEMYRMAFGEDLPSLTPEVRSVFDRMLAAEEDINRAEAVRQRIYTFETRESFPGTDAEWARYRALADAAREGGIAKLVAALQRDQAWLGRERSKIAKELAKEAKEARKEAGAQATRELLVQPVYRLRTWLKKGIHLDRDGKPNGAKDKDHKIRSADLRAVLGVEAHDLMTGELADVHSEKGFPIDFLAEFFYSPGVTGMQMVDDLRTAPPLSEAIEQRTDEIMWENNSLHQSAQDQEIAIEEALTNEAYSKLVGETLKMLSRAGSDRITRLAIKMAAKQRLLATPLRKIQPRLFHAAESKAAKEAREAFAGKRARGDTPAKTPDLQKGVAAVQRQLVHATMARTSARIARDVEKKVGVLRRQFFTSDEKLAKRRNVDFVNAGRYILAAFGLGRGSALPLSYLEGVKQNDPAAYERLRPIIEEATGLNSLQDYKDLTLAQWNQVADVLDSLWEMSRRDYEIDADGTMVARAAAIIDLLASATNVLGQPDMTVRGPVSPEEARSMSFAGLKAKVTRVEAWARHLDGGQGTGPWQRFLFRPVRNRFSLYMADREKYAGRMFDLVSKADLSDVDIHLPEIKHTFRNMDQLLGALLMAGNLSGKRAMLLPYGWATEQDGVLNSEKWDLAIHNLTERGILRKEHFDLLQSLWDLNDELRPVAQKVNRAVYGVYFKEIDALPFENKYGKYRGGYAPAPVDLKHRGNADLRTRDTTGGISTDMERDFRESWVAKANGFTIERKAGAMRPRMLSLRSQVRHFDQVLRFIHLQPAVRDVEAIIHDKTLRPILERLAPGAVDNMLIPWLQDTANNRMTKPTSYPWLDTFFSFLRRTTGQLIMFASLRNSLQQATGISNFAVYVPYRHLANGWRRAGDDTTTRQFVVDKSAYMRERLDNSYGQILDNIELLLEPSRWAAVQRWTSRHAFFAQRFVQSHVDITGWLGAYDYALSQGKDETAAVQEADSIVRLSQGSTTPVDVAAYERSTPFVRLFTQFSAYYNSVLNQIMFADRRGPVIQIGDKEYNLPGAEMFRVILHAMTFPALASAAIAAGLSGLEEFDDDDNDGALDEVLFWLLSSQVKATGSMAPGFGPIVVQPFTSEKQYGDRINLAPAFTTLQSAGRVITATTRDFRFGGSQIRDLGNVLSAATGIPVTPLTRALAFYMEKGEGKRSVENDNWFSGLTGNAR